MIDKEDNPYEAPKTSDFRQPEENKRTIMIYLTLFILMLFLILYLIFPIMNISELIISFLKDMGYEMSIKNEGYALMLFFTALMSLFIIIYLFGIKLFQKIFQAA